MNILNERYQFYCRQQTDRETVEEFIVSLYQLAASCNFDNQEEWLIRDHILFGLSNKNISMKIIQDGGNPTLSEVIEMCASLHGGVYNAAEESNHGVGKSNIRALECWMFENNQFQFQSRIRWPIWISETKILC